MDDIIFVKTYDVNSLQVNREKRPSLYGLLGFLQDIGAKHAEHLGFGESAMSHNDRFWVYARKKLIMKKWPQWHNQVTIKTWPRGLKGLKANRDFIIYCNNEIIGECVATFMAIDTKTRRPVIPKLPQSLIDKFPQNTLNFEPEKVILPPNMAVVNSISVKESDLDNNNHANNTKYALWVLDSLPLSFLGENEIKEFEINFLAEANLNDEIQIHMHTEKAGPSEKQCFFQGVRVSDNIVVFTSRLSFQSLSKKD